MVSADRAAGPMEALPQAFCVDSAQTLGVFDHLDELDVSDCGCNLDTIALFGRAILARHDQGKLSLRKLRLFGMSPNARRQAKAVFPVEFIVKCGVC